MARPPSQTLPRLHPRYDVREKIGEGGMAVIYKAWDRHENDLVVIKVSTDAGFDDKLKNEFSILRFLIHPSLPRAFHLHRLPDNRWMYTLEWIPHDSIQTWIHQKRFPSSDQMTNFLTNFLSCLQFLHGRGWIHRDIKPENILVDPRGNPKLLDFGLARTKTDPEILTQEGTLQYTAPEVIKKESCDERSDLYSLGVVLYEWLTGINPFEDANVVNIVVHHLQKKIESVPSSATAWDPLLESWVLKCLEKDPALRFQNVFEMYDFLSHAETWKSVPQPESAIQLVFGGRDSQLRALRDQEAAVHWIQGPDGIGKTTVIQRFQADVEQEASTSIDFRFLKRPGMSNVRSMAKLAVSQSDSSTLEHYAAEIAWVNGESYDAVDEIGLFAGLSELFFASIDKTIDHVVIDDFDHASPLEQKFLTYLLRKHILRGKNRLTFTLTSTAEPPPDLPSDSVNRILLDELTESQLRNLATLSLNDPNLTEDFTGWLFSVTRGNPFLADQTLRFVIRSHALVQAAGKWDWRPDHVVAVPDSVTAFVDAQIQSLPAAEREYFRLISVFPESFSESDLAAISEIQSGNLNSLVRRGLIDNDGDRYRITSRYLQDSAYRELDAPLKIRFHTQLAAYYAHNPTAIADVAFHKARGENPRSAVPDLLNIARQQQAQFLVHEATESLRMAAELSDQPAERIPILLALEEQLDRLGHTEEQASVIQEIKSLAEREADGKAMIQGLLREANYHDRQSRHQDARTACEKAIERSRTSADHLLGQLYRQLGKTFYKEANYDQAEQCYRNAFEIAEKQNDERLKMEAHNSLGTVYGAKGVVAQSRTEFERTLALSRTLHDRLSEINALFNLRTLAIRENKLDEALKILESVKPLITSLRHRAAECQYEFYVGRVYSDMFRLEESLTSYDRCIAIALEINSRTYIMNAQQNKALMLAKIGLCAEARKLIRNAVAGMELNARETAIQSLYEAQIYLEDADFANSFEQAASAYDYFVGTGASPSHAAVAWAILALSAHSRSSSDKANLSPQSLLDLGIPRREEAFVLFSWANFNHAVNQTSEALEASQRAISLVQTLDYYEFDSARVFFQHYRLLCDRDHVDEAEVFLRLAYDQMQRTISSFKRSEYRKAYVDRKLSKDIVAAYTEIFDAKAGSDHYAFDRLFKISQEINSLIDTDKLFDRIMDHAIEHSGADRGLILLGSGAEWSTKVARNMDQQSLSDISDISQSIVRDVMSSNQPLITADANLDERFKERKSIVAYDIRSIMCVPLRVKDSIIGVVYLDKRFDASHFGPDQIRFIDAFANLAGVAIENATLYERLKIENSQLFIENIELRTLVENQTFDIVGQSPVMNQVFELIKRAKDTDATVVIEGESGTGKELVARAIHFNGSRRRNRFITVDCGALPESLLESELFGHKKGAFTGANTDKKGLFEVADGGSIFLDEITNTSLAFQAKLLRAIQEREIRRVGDDRQIKIDIRIISATNKNIEAMIADGTFREDLFYRLNVIPIKLPPLRERKEDIPLLVNFFVKRHAESNAKEIDRISRDFLDELTSYEWPGNIRELDNLLNRVVIFSDGKMLSKKHLPANWKKQSAAEEGRANSLTELEAQLLEMERSYFANLLQRSGGNKSKVADILQIKRTTLNDRLKKLGL